jgi:hypothetical protein
MKKENLSVMTFMSWENECEQGLRAIALCEESGFFYDAINCVRDGDMGCKDENGVYWRTWYGDNIECYGNELDTLRPATKEEVELYLKYIPIDEAIGDDCSDKFNSRVARLSVNKYVSYVIVETIQQTWYSKLCDKIRSLICNKKKCLFENK